MGKEERAKELLEELYPGLTNEQVTEIQRQRLAWAEAHPLSHELQEPGL